MAASPVFSVPFSTESDTVAGSTAGLNLCFALWCVGAEGSWFVGGWMFWGWVNAYTACFIASGVASTTDAAPIMPVPAWRREETMCPLIE